MALSPLLGPWPSPSLAPGSGQSDLSGESRRACVSVTQDLCHTFSLSSSLPLRRTEALTPVAWPPNIGFTTWIHNDPNQVEINAGCSEKTPRRHTERLFSEVVSSSPSGPRSPRGCTPTLPPPPSLPPGSLHIEFDREDPLQSVSRATLGRLINSSSNWSLECAQKA